MTNLHERGALRQELRADVDALLAKNREYSLIEILATLMYHYAITDEDLQRAEDVYADMKGAPK